MKLILILIAIAIVGGFVIFLSIKNLLYICQPNEVLIFVGRKTTSGDRVLGYHLVKGGRRLRIPIIEDVYRMDLTNMVIPLSIRDAYSKGGIPLNIDAVANVKISGFEPTIFNAVERLLGKRREEIMNIAKETLEGNLRGVLATLTPEEVNEDKTAFQKKLIDEAEQDLERLGLKLDTLNIQNISDDKGYLDSIGRKRAAEIRKEAKIAEAKAHAESEIKNAENTREIELAKIKAETERIKAEADRRIIDAQTKREAVIAEERSKVASQIAKAQAEVEVQRARIEQMKRKLEADLVVPARAQMESAIAKAIGDAAKIVEDGRATAQALQSIAEIWKIAGPKAKEIFLLQKLNKLIETSLSSIQKYQIEQLTYLPAPSSEQSVGGKNQLIRSLISASEQLKAFDIDLSGIIKKLTGDENRGTLLSRGEEA